MTDTTHERTRTVMRLAPAEEPSSLPTLVRNSYWHGKTMGVEEFVRDQEYHRTVQQTLTRLTVGCGVLCGLTVSRHGPAGVAVGAGAGVDGSGRLVVVDRAVTLDDLGRWICDPPGEPPSRAPGEYELCLVLHECLVAPAPVLVTDCDTRQECRAGAVAERYRFEARPATRSRCPDPCPGCAQRSSGHGRCGCDDGCRSCTSECDDCIPVAWFRWDGAAVTELTTQGRTELRPMREQTQPADVPDDAVGPRLVGLWPNPGQVLDRTGAPSDWGRWRYRPRLELCFDRPVDWDRIDDPGDWLRAWAVVPAEAATGTTSAPVVRRLPLRPLERATTTTDQGQTVVFLVDSDARVDVTHGVAEQGYSVVVQARATTDTGPAAADALSRTAQIEYAGTVLTAPQLDRLWEADELPDDVAPDALAATTAPGCFGDGYDGGRLHAVFTVAPVGDDRAATGLAPYNGARVRGNGPPALEVSSTAPLEGVRPRAWLVGPDGGVRELTVGDGEPLAAGATPRARERYASAFDTTLDAELAHTLTFTVAVGGSDPPPRGRVLVVVPTPGEAGGLGSFPGTCLTDAEAADVYAHGLRAEHLGRVRPSTARMPRAAAAGAWVHWTFAWEQTDVVIR